MRVPRVRKVLAIRIGPTIVGNRTNGAKSGVGGWNHHHRRNWRSNWWHKNQWCSDHKEEAQQQKDRSASPHHDDDREQWNQAEEAHGSKWTKEAEEGISWPVQPVHPLYPRDKPEPIKDKNENVYLQEPRPRRSLTPTKPPKKKAMQSDLNIVTDENQQSEPKQPATQSDNQLDSLPMMQIEPEFPPRPPATPMNARVNSTNVLLRAALSYALETL